MDSPDQGAKGIPIQVDRSSSGSISIKIPSIGASYQGLWLVKQIMGTFTQHGNSFPLTLVPGEPKRSRPQTPVAPFPYTTEDVSFANGDAVLNGTLVLPEGCSRKTPVLVMVTGSGLQNRDEELFDHKPFAVIADAFARAGIATLRYDDRGFGESSGDIINCTEYLNDIFNSIFLKDIIERFSIRDTSLLTRIVDFILDSTGKIVSSKSISDYLRTKEKIKVSPKTVYNYLDYLTNACLLYKVQREDIEGKKILSINEKYYCVDQGFNQVRIGRNQLNNSRIMENIVYFELLRRGYEITIGCVGDYEIDFVCKKMGEKIYVQVTRELTSEDTIEREFRPLLMVKDNYPKYVISTDEFDMSHDGIKHMNILDFLLDDKI